MSPDLFFSLYGKIAQDEMIRTGIPASIILAQGALESAWGESGLTKQGNNFFGIKDFVNDSWTGGVIEKDTTEYVNGVAKNVVAKFRKYESPADSFRDHSEFLQDNPRYNALFGSTEWQSWAYGLQEAGYATDPSYAIKLIGLIQKYNLAQYDVQPKEQRRIRTGVIVAIIAVVLILIIYITYKYLLS